MKFDIITIFPDIFNSYFQEGILKRAQEQKLIEVAVHNLRDWVNDKRKTVDDTPYGGGAGMVMKVEPIFKCVNSIVSEIRNPKSEIAVKSKSLKTKKFRIILFSAKGKKFSQKEAKRLSGYENLILICGRYEGIDERIAKYVADDELSIGDYVLTGGEIPAMILADSITRILPGVLGNPESLTEESFSAVRGSGLKKENSVLEYPHYTKPEVFNNWRVPSVLLSGNHESIRKWRKNHSEKR